MKVKDFLDFAGAMSTARIGKILQDDKQRLYRRNLMYRRQLGRRHLSVSNTSHYQTVDNWRDLSSRTIANCWQKNSIVITDVCIPEDEAIIIEKYMFPLGNNILMQTKAHYLTSFLSNSA